MFILDADVLSNLRKPKNRIFGLGLDAATILASLHETASLRHVLVGDPRQRSFKSPADLAIAEKAVVATGNHSHFAEINAAFPLRGHYNPFTDVGVVSRAPG